MFTLRSFSRFEEVTNGGFEPKSKGDSEHFYDERFAATSEFDLE